jgi:hypothetical protein
MRSSHPVIPAKAGIPLLFEGGFGRKKKRDPRFRGDDEQRGQREGYATSRESWCPRHASESWNLPSLWGKKETFRSNHGE